MNTLSTAADREDFARRVMNEFSPIMRRLGFGSPRWDYDDESETICVQFDDRRRKNAVQIDYSVEDDRYSANYCRNEDEWQICSQGKPGKLRKLKGTLSDWLLKTCEDCCIDCEPTEPWEEYEDAAFLVPTATTPVTFRRCLRNAEGRIFTRPSQVFHDQACVHLSYFFASGWGKYLIRKLNPTRIGNSERSCCGRRLMSSSAIVGALSAVLPAQRVFACESNSPR